MYTIILAGTIDPRELWPCRRMHVYTAATKGACSHMAKWDHESAWLVPPRQERSRQTLERILDAAEALFTQKGY